MTATDADVDLDVDLGSDVVCSWRDGLEDWMPKCDCPAVWAFIGRHEDPHKTDLSTVPLHCLAHLVDVDVTWRPL